MRYAIALWVVGALLAITLARCEVDSTPIQLCEALEELPTPARACDYLAELCPEGARGKAGYTCQELVAMSWPLPGENGDDRVKFGYNPTAISHQLCTLRHYSQPGTDGCTLWRSGWCGKTGRNGCIPWEPPQKFASPEAGTGEEL